MRTYGTTGDSLIYLLGIELGESSEPLPTSAWIDPDGRFFPVPDCGHETFAYQCHETNGSALERNGWAHLSFGNVYYERRLSQRQIDTLFDTVNVYLGSGYRYAGTLANTLQYVLGRDD